MKTVLFNIKDGQLLNKFSVKRAFDLPNGSYELRITKKSKRSLSQNAYYWGCCIALVHEGLRDMGNDVTIQETHEYLKARFNVKEIVNTDTGEILNVPKSTSELSKEEFGIYIDRIQQFAAEYLNVTIPSPNTQSAMSFT